MPGIAAVCQLSDKFALVSNAERKPARLCLRQRLGPDSLAPSADFLPYDPEGIDDILPAAPADLYRCATTLGPLRGNNLMIGLASWFQAVCRRVWMDGLEILLVLHRVKDECVMGGVDVHRYSPVFFKRPKTARSALPTAEMHARLVIPLFQSILLGWIADRGQRKRNYVGWQIEQFAEALDSTFDRIDAQPHRPEP
jgi:hypothetical protein